MNKFSILSSMLALSLPLTAFSQVTVGDQKFDQCGGSDTEKNNPKLYANCNEELKQDSMLSDMWANGKCGGAKAEESNAKKYKTCYDKAISANEDRQYSLRELALKLCGGNDARKNNFDKYVECKQTNPNIEPLMVKREKLEHKMEQLMSQVAQKCAAIAKSRTNKKFETCFNKDLVPVMKTISDMLNQQAALEAKYAVGGKDTASLVERDSNDCAVSTTGSTATCSGVLYKRDTSGSILDSANMNKLGKGMYTAPINPTGGSEQDYPAPASLAK